MPIEPVFPSAQPQEAISAFVEACRVALPNRISTSEEDRLKGPVVT